MLPMMGRLEDALRPSSFRGEMNAERELRSTRRCCPGKRYAIISLVIRQGEVRRLSWLAEAFWRVFEHSGSIVAYLLYKHYSFH